MILLILFILFSKPDGLMTNSTNSVSIEIKLGRRLLSVILTSFVPTFILVLVTKKSLLYTVSLF